MDQLLHERKPTRVWSTSCCSFVSLCHDFLGILITNDVYWCTIPPRAVHTCQLCCMHTVLHCMAHAKWSGQNNAEKRHSLLQSASNYWSHLVLHVLTYPLLTLQHNLWCKVDQTLSTLVKGLVHETICYIQVTVTVCMFECQPKQLILEDNMQDVLNSPSRVTNILQS